MRLDLLNNRGAMLAHPQIAPTRVFTSHIRNLSWLATFLAVLLINFVQAHAAKQKTVRKETAKAKANPGPVSNRSGTARESRPIFRSPFSTLPDLLERREHMTDRVRAGETVAQFLARYGLSPADRQLWSRSIGRDLGRQTLPAGRDIHLYFAKPMFRRQNQLIPGQLKALELDQDDVSTLA